MKLILIFLFVGVLFPGPSQACHWTHIEVRNGTKCCRLPEVVRTVKEAKYHPSFLPAEITTISDKGEDIITNENTVMVTRTDGPATDDLSSTGNIETTTTKSLDPGPGPVGDCPCGAVHMREPQPQPRLLAQDPAGVQRPWLARVNIEKESGEPVECTATLLNMRWLISAAHCLCGTVVRCHGDYSAYTKVFNFNQFDNSRIKISMEGDPDIEAAKVIKLVIHPNYFSYTGNTVLGNTDLALLRMDRDLFQMEEGKILGNISPICLPAKLGFEVGKDHREDGIHQPFEDLDCFLIEAETAVPYPYHRRRTSRGWLACHPGALSAADQTDIAGRSSRITAYGSPRREDFNQEVRGGRCLTNSYGPGDSILEPCTGQCHQGTGEAGQDNPSQANKICADFMETKLREALEIHERRMGSEEEKRLNFLGWIKIKEEAGELTCYPHKSEALQTAQNMWDFPYRYGWCKVCGTDGARLNCEAEPGSGWGWCLPQCQQNATSSLQQGGTNIAREAHVESFVYENCSSNVNVLTEFCTGAPLVSGYGQVWTFKGGKFELVGHEVRKYHQEEEEEEEEEGNKTTSSYRTVQHHEALGGACYGDAGGAVWKLWKFFAEDGSGRMEERAVLTGVLSRFEEQCGVLWSSLRDRKAAGRHSMVHTRVTSVLDWINKWIADGKCSQ